MLINAFLFLLVYLAFTHMVTKIEIPFTCDFGLQKSDRNILSTFMGMGLITIGAVINYFISSNIYLMCLYGVILAIAAIYLWKKCIKAY